MVVEMQTLAAKTANLGPLTYSRFKEATAAQTPPAARGVRLDVLALNGKTPHSGLTRDDFEVRDNGVRQHLDSVSTTDAAHVVVVRIVAGRRHAS